MQPLEFWIQDNPTPDETAATTEDARPLIDQPPPVLWVGFGALLLIFLLVMLLIIRGRVIKPAERKAAGEKTFFEPAGADAEITFDDPNETDAAEQPKKRGWFGRKKEAPRENVAPQIDFPEEPQGHPYEAEVVIDREAVYDVAFEDAEPQEEQAAERKGMPFSGLFEKKEKASIDQRRDEIGDPGRPEARYGARRESRDEAEAEKLAAAEEARRALEAAEDERRARLAAEEAAAEEDRRQAEEDERRRLEEQRRFEEEQHRRAAEQEEAARRHAAQADEQARRRAEMEAQRAAESEQHKLTQRLADSEARERALFEKTKKLESETRLLSDRIDRAFDEKFSALASLVEQKLDASRQQTALREPAAPGISEAFFAEFAELMGEQINAIRASTTASLDDIRSRLNALTDQRGGANEPRMLSGELDELKQLIRHRSPAQTAPRVQLSDIVSDALPANRYEMTSALSNGRIADCLVKLTAFGPTIAIDARFPLDAYDAAREKSDTDDAYRRAVLRHIATAAEDLVIAGETADSAIVFVPSESIFTELHARYPDIVQESYRARVWLASPTSLMATLHTLAAIANTPRPDVGGGAGYLLQELADRISALETRLGAGDAPEAEPTAPLPLFERSDPRRNGAHEPTAPTTPADEETESRTEAAFARLRRETAEQDEDDGSGDSDPEPGVPMR